MPTQEYYPALKDLIKAEAIPGDFSAIEDLLQNGIDLVLAKIWYKDLAVDVSSDGETKHYSLTILTKRLKVPIFGSGMNLVFFRDATSNLSGFPLAFEWKWALQKYIDGLESQGFSYAPEAFVEIIMELAEIDSKQDFYKAIIEVFLNDGDTSYQSLLSVLATRLTDYDNGNPSVTAEINNIVTQLGTIETVVNSLIGNTSIFSPLDLLEEYKNYPSLLSAVESIDASIKTLDLDHTIDIDLTADIIRIALDGFSNFDEKIDRLGRLFRNWFGDIGIDDIKELLIPQFAIELQNINLALEFPRNWLIPALEYPAASGNYIEDPDLTKLAALEFTVGNLKYSTSKGFEFENQSSFTFERAYIGNTGIMLEFINLKVDMSDTYNIPEADADGRPADFQGVYAESASVTLPADWFKDTDGTNAEIFGKNLLIGTGGLSGTVGLQALGGDNMFWASIGENDGFRIGFESFDITFKQNKVTQSNIVGAMEIAKFVYPQSSPYAGQPVTIGIAGHIHDNGDFNLTASAAPPYPIEWPDVFTYHIASLELGKEDDDWYVGTSGSIEFMGFLKDTLKLGSIDIDRLRIYSDGSIEFSGGSINLIEPIVLKLGPVEITVSAIHYGSHQKEVAGVMRKFNYFGFDGGLSVDPLGVEIRGDGVKFYYCVDDLPNKPDPYLHIQTLYLDLTIPASSPAVIFNGWLSIPEPGVSQEYAGGIKLQIPQAKISGSADMKLMPRYPAFIIDVSIDLPAPIAIGPVGIYGFRGLIGYRYVAEKEAVGLVSGVDSWYDYYKHPPRGIHVTKFNGPDRTTLAGTPFSLGVGASLGTSFDNGTIVNIRAMILLSIPSLFMIDGRAAILSARLGLEDSGEPPFFAFIALGDNSLEFGIGADFKMPTSTGKTLTLYADIQAGFFFDDSSKWYVNVGTKTNPVTARVLTLVTIKSFLMMAAQGIEAGARGEFDFKRQYGPIKVHAWAYIEVGGKISFEKPQFGAYLAAGVGADIDIKIVSLYAAFDILFGVEAPKPFLIYGEFHFCVKITIAWVFKFKFCGDLTVMWEFDQNVDRTPINPLINPGNAATIPDIVKGVSMLSNETFELAYLGSSIPGSPTAAILNTILPLDTYVDIKTEKGFIPTAVGNLIGGVNNPPDRYLEMVPPQKIIHGKEVRQVKHQYSIESLSVKSWNPQTSSWQDYNPYEALYPGDPGLSGLKIGQFQKSGKQYNTIRLLATTPFSYTEQGEPGWFVPEQNGITPASLFCEGDQLVPECANFLEKPLGTKYFCYNENQLFYSHEAAFLLIDQLDGDYAEVVSESNPFAFGQSLAFPNTDKLQIRLPEPSVQVSLKITSYSQSVRIKYYASLIDDTTLQVQYGNPDSSAANPDDPFEVIVSGSALNSPVIYNHPEWLAVTRIVVEPLSPNQAQIDALIEQIAAINDLNNLIALGLAEGQQQDTKELEAQLIKLLSQSCTTIKGEPCRKDEECCKVYEALLDIQRNCLVDPAQYSDIDVKDYMACVESAMGMINSCLRNHPSEQVAKYVEVLKAFLANPNKQTYTNMWTAFQAILDYIYKVANCGCSEETVTKCTTLLHEVCWLSLENYQFNLLIPGQAAIEADYQATVDGITQYIQPIWRPDTSYAVSFSLKDVVDDGASSPGNYSYSYGFTTGGPVGYFHKNPSADYIDPGNPQTELYPLTSLTRYIDYERSYPNADGNLLSSKPLFYDDETTQIDLFFSKAYATHFFHNWAAYNGLDAANGRIKIVIKDPREDVSITNPPYLDYDPMDTVYTNLPQTIESWEDDPNPQIPFVFQQYANMIAANDCIATGGNPIIPPSQSLQVKMKHLKPLKLYTAIVNNLYDLDKDGNLNDIDETLEVHKFGFQTSRYKNFKEQVESFIMRRDNKIGLERKTPELTGAYATVDIQAGVDTITGTPNVIGDALIPTYPNKYDRVVQGILGLSAFTTPSEGQEFRLIRDTNTEEVIAVVLLSAAPLNSTRFSEAEALSMMKVFGFLGTEDTNYKVALSGNYTQAIIMHTSLSFVGNLMGFQFQHPITGEAVFQISKGLSAAEITAAYDTIMDNPNPLSDDIEINYQHKFDRIFEGIWGFTPMDKAMTTEFNVIRNSSDSDKVVALIIRNPEPFNNPRIPLDIIQDTIQVLNGSGVADANYKMLFSKDYSQVLVMHSSMEITSTDLDLKFIYKVWNGSAYIVPAIPDYSSDTIGTIQIDNLNITNN